MAAQEQGKEWIHKSSACCSPLGDGCLTFWCPCIMYGRIQHRLKVDPDLKGYKKKNEACMAYFWLALCSLHFVNQANQRDDITDRYGLKRDEKNTVRALCCANCDLMQQEKEIVSREQEKAALVAEQPAPVAAMSYGGADEEKTSVKE